jgi:hypothetical protein
MKDFIPRGELAIQDALDFVGGAKFGESWLGAETYNAEYDKTVKEGPKKLVEATTKRAVENYSSCRVARELLRKFLCGSSPEHRDGVTSRMLIRSGETVVIDGYFWASWWEALVVFRTGRIKQNIETTGAKWAGSHGPQGECFLEGPVVISEQELTKAVRKYIRVGNADAGLPPNSCESLEGSAMVSKGGRPRIYDWEEFAREIVVRAHTPDGLPDRATLTNEMAQWCLNTWGKEPAESVLRAWIAKFYPS